MPQPRITDVTTKIDIYPEAALGLGAAARMWLENKTSSDIDRVAVTLWPVDLITPLPRPHIQVKQLSFRRRPDARSSKIRRWASTSTNFPRRCRRTAAFSLIYALQYDNPGFENAQPNTDIVHNGSFVNDRYLPYIGYAHEHRVDRRQHAPQPWPGQSPADAEAR